MKTIRTTPRQRTLIGRALFAGFALVSPSLYAQTFTGQDHLSDSPGSLRAVVYPIPNKPTICINVDNGSRSEVRLQILNEAKTPVYDKWIHGSEYGGRFDVSALPSGVYTVELSTREARHTQTFRLEPPKYGRVVMAPELPRRDVLADK